MKRLLIISPHFPPINAADMQRIRMSLPYFKDLGWEAEVVVVDEKFSDSLKDPLLVESIPTAILVHKVKAFPKKITSKFGLGSLALRSLWFYKKKVNQLLRNKKFDLIYFSTTEFPVCILGAYWKNKFGIPYVIDMQDPWHSEYYQDKPKYERPKKYWFSYRLHKYLEPIAMRDVGGLISVSNNYIQLLVERYPHLNKIPKKVITFGAFDVDFKIADKHHKELNLIYDKNPQKINIVYIGRGGFDMQPAIRLLLGCFKQGLVKDRSLFERIHFHFIGTSYATKGTGTATLAPIAEQLDLSTFITENTDRIGFYQSLKNLQNANGLLIIGSNDVAYNASKLYPYIFAKKPLLAIFQVNSAAAKLVETCEAGNLITLDQTVNDAYPIFEDYIKNTILKKEPSTNWNEFEQYTAAALTEKQVQIFNQVVTIEN